MAASSGSCWCSERDDISGRHVAAPFPWGGASHGRQGHGCAASKIETRRPSWRSVASASAYARAEVRNRARGGGGAGEEVCTAATEVALGGTVGSAAADGAVAQLHQTRTAKDRARFRISSGSRLSSILAPAQGWLDRASARQVRDHSGTGCPGTPPVVARRRLVPMTTRAHVRL